MDPFRRVARKRLEMMCHEVLFLHRCWIHRDKPYWTKSTASQSISWDSRSTYSVSPDEQTQAHRLGHSRLKFCESKTIITTCKVRWCVFVTEDPPWEWWADCNTLSNVLKLCCYPLPCGFKPMILQSLTNPGTRLPSWVGDGIFQQNSSAQCTKVRYCFPNLKNICRETHVLRGTQQL